MCLLDEALETSLALQNETVQSSGPLTRRRRRTITTRLIATRSYMHGQLGQVVIAAEAMGRNNLTVSSAYVYSGLIIHPYDLSRLGK